jgi:hypothetical protein
MKRSCRSSTRNAPAHEGHLRSFVDSFGDRPTEFRCAGRSASREEGFNVPAARPSQDPARRKGAAIEDDLEIQRRQALGIDGHERGTLDAAQCAQGYAAGGVHAQLGERRAPIAVARPPAGQPSRCETYHPRTQPGGGPLRVAQRGRATRAIGQGRRGYARRLLAIAERHEQREAMQPRAMQVSESSAQQAVIGTRARQDAGAARGLLLPLSRCAAQGGRRECRARDPVPSAPFW